jgi:hypothetical protein
MIHTGKLIMKNGEILYVYECEECFFQTSTDVLEDPPHTKEECKEQQKVNYTRDIIES